jgi:hypothetical protein
MWRPEADSSTAVMEMYNASIAVSVSQPTAAKWICSISITPSDHSAREPISDSSNPATNPEDAPMLKPTIATEANPEPTPIGGRKTAGIPENKARLPTGGRIDDTAAASKDFPNQARPTSSQIIQCHNITLKKEPFSPVRPYLMIEQDYTGDYFLLDTPFYIFRIWMCIMNSNLVQNIVRLSPQRRFALLSTYREMFKNNPLPLRRHSEHQETYSEIIPSIPLPRKMSKAELASDVISIFDACFAGCWKSPRTEGSMSIWNTQGNRAIKQDYEYLTHQTLLVYDSEKARFEEAQVKKIWKPQEWDEWIANMPWPAPATEFGDFPYQAKIAYNAEK